MLRRALTCAALALAAKIYTARTFGLDEPVHAELDWRDGPSGSNCIDEASLRSAVEARLGRTVFTRADSADVRVIGSIRSREGAWQVNIQLLSAQGEPMGARELQTQARDCSALDDSLALVLAVMLDIPKTKVPTRAPVPEDSRTSEVEVPVQHTRLRVPEDTPPNRPAWHFEAGVNGVVALGLLPATAWGVRAQLAFTPPAFWKLGIDFAAYGSVDEPVPGTTAGASFSPLEAGWYFCPLAWAAGAVDLETCVLQRFGRLRVEGFGFDANQTQTRTYAKLGLSLAAVLEISEPLFLRVGLDLETPLVRETFRYGAPSGEEPSLFRMDPVLLSGQLGLMARF